MTTKIAVSLPDELVTAARQAVADGRAASVSAYVAEAIADRRADEDLARLLDEMDAEHGPPTGEHFAWARRALGLGE
jgi:Arc/MetJ-type ribon-helix-helix transcriptional regulator